MGSCSAIVCLRRADTKQSRLYQWNNYIAERWVYVSVVLGICVPDLLYRNVETEGYEKKSKYIPMISAKIEVTKMTI